MNQLLAYYCKLFLVQLYKSFLVHWKYWIKRVQWKYWVQGVQSLMLVQRCYLGFYHVYSWINGNYKILVTKL